MENKFHKGDVVIITSHDSSRGQTGVIDEVIKHGACYDYLVIPSNVLPHIKPNSAYSAKCTVCEEDLVLLDHAKTADENRRPINIVYCRNCGSININVIDTEKDLIKDNGVIYRRRKCLDCNYRFTTFEIHQDDYRRLFPST